ncbi:MAG: winged helix-turn-helix domain-containing protein [Acutalibacteraceae bacterium]
MNLMELSSDGKVAYLIKPILKVLQEAGGQLERSEIKERIADLDDQIAEFSEIVKKSKKTGNTYKEFNFKFNFAIKDLLFNNLLTYTNSSPITLTEKGLYLELDTLDVQKDIIETSKKHWDELSNNNKKNKIADVSDNEEETQAEEKIKDDFKETLLASNSVARIESEKKNLKPFPEHLLKPYGC